MNDCRHAHPRWWAKKANDILENENASIPCRIAPFPPSTPMGGTKARFPVRGTVASTHCYAKTTLSVSFQCSALTEANS